MKSILNPEYSKKVLSLAYPVILGMMARTAMGVVDTAMVGRLGSAELAATGLGIHVVLLFVYSFGSVSIGVQALTARRYGESNFELCGRNINGTIILIAAIGFIGAVTGYIFAPVWFRFLTDDPIVSALGSEYVSIRMLEMFAMAFIGVYRGFFDGIGKTSIYMRAMIAMNALNIILNYMLIFGKFGFPRLEVAGAAIGSLISSYVGGAIMIAYSLRSDHRKQFNLYSNMKPDFILFKRLYKLASPTMLQTFIEIGGFTLFFVLVGKISTVGLAASNVCVAIISVSFMPGIGIGTAAATLVGQYLGAKRADISEKLGKEAMKLGVIFMGTLGIIFILIPEIFIRLFTPDKEIIESGITILRIVGLVQLFDAIGIVSAKCLQSAGMTRYVLQVTVFTMALFFLPLSYLLGITFGLGISGAWIGLALYLLLYGVILILKFNGGKWKTVII